MRKFAFFYLMVEKSEAIPRAVPKHVQYWEAHRTPGYIGGPFTDRSGGLIVFEASDLSAAGEIAGDDPFLKEGLLAQWWLKGWGAR